MLSFLSCPSKEKLLQLGDMRTELQHQVRTSCEENNNSCFVCAHYGRTLCSHPARWMHPTHIRPQMPFWKSLLCTVRNRGPGRLFWKLSVNTTLLCCILLNALYSSFCWCRVMCMGMLLSCAIFIWMSFHRCCAEEAPLCLRLSVLLLPLHTSGPDGPP